MDRRTIFIGTISKDAELVAWVEVELLGISLGKNSAPGEEDTNFRP